jgi:malate dehydrogenase (oxaloacetate-decarboxylating)
MKKHMDAKQKTTEDYFKESLAKHAEWKGKIEIKSRVDVSDREKLGLAYTPGVASPCLAIQKNVDLSYDLTRRGNAVAVITDGTAILGLGDIGPEAGMPVMEGKCVLFKTFGNVDAWPICLRTKDTEEIIRTIKIIAGSFGGINLEDISSPRCFEIESRLKKECDVPVFHDDQHGTAIVCGAAVVNALKVVKKDISKVHIVISGAGAAGTSIARFLLALGAKNIILTDKDGAVYAGQEGTSPAREAIAELTNLEKRKGTLKDMLVGADVFIGVSVGGIVKGEMIKSMADNPVVFPLANPVPEISHDEAVAAGAAVIGTGSSQYPNQINNVLVFPGVFRGALDVRAKDINEEMMLAASETIASSVKPEELDKDHILPSVFDKDVHLKIAKAVSEAARKTGVARK